MKILFAADGSPCSMQAAKYLIQQSSMFKDTPELTVIHVEPAVLPPNVTRHVSREVVDDWYKEQGDIALRDVTQALDAAGVPYTRKQLVGDVAPTLIKTATEIGADMIVMGSHGRSATAGVLLGSVATKLLSGTKIPVLIIR
ncbi:MAG TPA: universal stress protein [Burkholderiaceae bacterium]|nr:universal stress protein [Burkholderiaceae bacterium]